MLSLSTLWALPPLTRLTLIALLGSALAFASEMVMLGPDLSVSIVVACVLAGCALTATGWPPLIGAAVIATITANNPFLVENLAHPDKAGFFAATVFNLGCATVAVIAGIGATIVNYRCR